MPDAIHHDVPASFETPRLRLQTFAPEHAAALHQALSESFEHLRAHLWFLPWLAEAPTLRSAEARCRQAQANWLLRADLPYLVFDKASMRLVGSAGLHRTDWALPKTEVGYWVRSSDVGKGYATESVSALVQWALHGLRAQRVELVVDERNTASRAVAARCGFALEATLRHTGRSPDGVLRNTCIYSRFADAG